MNRDGVGVFEVRRRKTTARRYAYRMQTGEQLGPRLRVVVTCGVPACCNWRHLRARSARAIALTNGSAAAVNDARTVCARGHPLVEENLYERPGDGRQECLTCKRIRAGHPAWVCVR